MRKKFLAVFACAILAFACLAGVIYTTTPLMYLVNKGKTADVQVIGIDVGPKGSKRAALQFVTDTGSTTVSRDLFQMMISRFSKGDRVTVLYNPSDVSLVTIGIGVWVWHQPVFFFLGFVLLSFLGILFLRY